MQSRNKRFSTSHRLNPPICVEPMEPRLLLSAVHQVGKHLKAIKNFKVTLPLETELVSGATAGNAASPAVIYGSSSPIGVVTPAEMAGAYLGKGFNFFGVTGDGTGETIAIVDAYDDPGFVSTGSSGFASSDLAGFDAAYGLANPPSFTKYGVDGNTGALSTTSFPSTDPNGPTDATGQTTWEGEESLDVEWAHAMAPGASIDLIEVSSPSNLFQGLAAVDSLAGVNVVSMSWSTDEAGLGNSSGEASYNSTYFYKSSITYVASTGDQGAYGAGSEDTTIEPQYPASSVDVVAVGGSTLSVAGTSWAGESTWGDGTSSGSAGGGGGGVSLYASRPSYQSSILPAASNREYPDVALDANPSSGVAVYDSFDFGSSTPWFNGLYGGTSLAAPLMAGIVAVADQGRALDGKTTLNSNGKSGGTNIHTLLYSSTVGGTSTNYDPNSDYHDITTGQSIGPAPTYSPSAGFDLTSGLGSPVAGNLVFDLTSISTTPAASLGAITNLYYKQDSTSTITDVWVNAGTPGTGTPTYKFNDAEISSLTYNGGAGNDVFTVNFAAGSAFASSLTSITYNASTGGINTLNIIGSASNNDTITASASNVSVGSTTIAFNNASILNLNPGTGSDVLAINSGTWNITPQSAGGGILMRHFSSLSIAAGAALLIDTATLHTDRMLIETSALSDAGQLDLGGNDMIIHNGNLTSINALLATGFDNGIWNGIGIASSAAHNDTTHLTALGAIANNLYGGTGQPQFDGVSPLTSDILIKYTYYGDSDLNGKIDGTDYSRIDNGYLTSATGWANGDFNYDNHVDGSDYSLIDNAFNTQGNTL